MKFEAREIESYNMELADVKKYEGNQVNAYVYKDFNLEFPAKHDYLILEFNHGIEESTKMVCSMANLGVELVIEKKENEW